MQIEYVWISEPSAGRYVTKCLVMVRQGGPPKDIVKGIFERNADGKRLAKRRMLEHVLEAKYFRHDVRVIPSDPEDQRVLEELLAAQ